MRGARRPLRIVMSVGPTREPLDPVRFLSNYSTGYMGAQLVAEAQARGHRVTAISGPVAEALPARSRIVSVETARQMQRALLRAARGADVVMMAAAVSDFRPARVASMKLPRRASRTVRLRATPDIVARLPRRAGQVIVGFALETGAVVARARRKLWSKRLDLLLAQRADGTHAIPFGRRNVHAWLLQRRRAGAGGLRRAVEVTRLGSISKGRIARVLLDKVEALWYGQHHAAARR